MTKHEYALSSRNVVYMRLISIFKVLFLFFKSNLSMKMHKQMH